MSAVLAVVFDVVMGFGLLVASYLLMKKKIPFLKYFVIIAVPLSIMSFYRVIYYLDAYNQFHTLQPDMIAKFEIVGNNSITEDDIDAFSEWLNELECLSDTTPYNFNNANVISFRLKSGEVFHLRVLDFPDNTKLVKLVSDKDLSYFTYGFFKSKPTKWGKEWVVPVKD
jgi:hypothetical protein